MDIALDFGEKFQNDYPNKVCMLELIFELEKKIKKLLKQQRKGIKCEGCFNKIKDKEYYCKECFIEENQALGDYLERGEESERVKRTMEEYFKIFKELPPSNFIISVRDWGDIKINSICMDIDYKELYFQCELI